MMKIQISDDIKAWLSSLIFAFLVMFFLGLILLALAISEGIKLSDPVDTAFANGLITASGIFLGFIMSAAISKGKEIRPSVFRSVEIALVVFSLAMFIVFKAEIKGKVTVFELLFLQSSLLYNFYVSYDLMHKVLKATR